MTRELIIELDSAIEAFGKRPFKGFVVPGGNLASSYCHVCRTVCRRAERLAVKMNGELIIVEYLNRLSLYFFNLALVLAERA